MAQDLPDSDGPGWHVEMRSGSVVLRPGVLGELGPLVAGARGDLEGALAGRARLLLAETNLDCGLSIRQEKSVRNSRWTRHLSPILSPLPVESS